jgi:hypothetical protein
MAYLPLVASGLWLMMAGAAYAQTCNNPAGLAGRGLMSDWNAAAVVKPTGRSIVEKNATGHASDNAAANSYYHYHGQSTTYKNQLAGFHNAWKGDAIMQRMMAPALWGQTLQLQKSCNGLPTNGAFHP